MQLKFRVKVVALLTATALALPVIARPMVTGFERFGADANTGVAPGLLLYHELKCTACHGLLSPRQSAFPQRLAPNLATVSTRVRSDYLQAFIAAPHTVKSGTTMPDLFAGNDPAEVQEASEALTHFLLSLGDPFEDDAEPPAPESLARGGRLYHAVGCVACHEPAAAPETGPADDVFAETVVEMPGITVPSVPLPDLAKKTSATALAAFLRDPGHARPGGRMPDMTLTESEVLAIAGWLVYGKKQPEAPGAAVPEVLEAVRVDPVRAGRGRGLFQSLGCAACHDLNEARSVPTAPTLGPEAQWDSGCLAPTPSERVPWFDLSEAQRTALAGLGTALDTPAPTPADTINHTLLALNCYACHERDGLGGPEPGRAVYFTETEELDLGDEGRLPPALTGVGAKLTPAWLHDILTDGGRVRPYMATRMPHFPEEHIAPLVEALRVADEDPAPLAVNVSGLEHHHRNMYGRELMGINGLGCVTCHDLNGQRSLGIPAVDLAYVPQRLQPEWFMKYMLNPAALRPQTRMPAFFENGKSLSSTLFNGDAVKQVEALWIYLREVKETRLPEGMEDNKNYELTPTDRPLVHRTFIQDVGTHAIAVGFPGGLNYAFDALSVRPALIWRGRFIDAESAQADRFVPFVKPLGEDILTLPAGAPIASGLDGPWPVVNEEIRYRGYRLDGDRVPVFRYTFHDVVVEESIRPTGDGKALLHRYTFTGPESTLYLWLGECDDVETEEQVYKFPNYTITLEDAPQAQRGPDDVGWVLPVAVTEAGTAVEQVVTWR